MRQVIAQQAGETVDNTVTGNLLTDNDVTGADAAKSSITEISYTPEGGGAVVSALVDPINGVTVVRVLKGGAIDVSGGPDMGIVRSMLREDAAQLKATKDTV